MAHWLKIIKDGKVEMIELDPKNPKTIKLKGGSQYELLDEQLNPIEPLKIVEDQAGLTLYTEAGDAPSLILQNYTRYQPLVSGSTITLNSEPVLASQVFSATAAQGISSSLLWAGGGILAAGAVAGVALSGSGSKGSSAPNNHQANTDTVSSLTDQNTTDLNGTEQQQTANKNQPREDITPTADVTTTPTEVEEENPTEEVTTTPTEVEEENPTEEVTITPTEVEEEAPTEEVTATPTPTEVEEETPTEEVTATPTEVEEETPTEEVTTTPTEVEEENPTEEVTATPTETEEENPSAEVTSTPTEAEEETPTEEVMATPTEVEEENPTEEATTTPTEVEEEAPTEEVTTTPTETEEENPSAEVTSTPTEAEEETPTEDVTTTPTEVEEENPSEEVTTTPTEVEEEAPTEEVTITPTEVEEENPTEEATTTPTEAEEETPSAEVTTTPTEVEEENLTEEVTTTPTEAEEETPSAEVTTTPTEVEEENPTEEVTATPTEVEEEAPTEEVTTTPTEVEEEAPTEEVTATPTEVEKENPTEEVTTTPTEAEEETPSEEVTTTPTEVEEGNPTEEVTTTPTEAEEETPTEDVTTTPTEVEEDSPTEEVTITPTEAEEENPTEEATATPTKAEEENPTEEVTTTPIEVEEETPSEEVTATPSPTEVEEETPTEEVTTTPTEVEEEAPTEEVTTTPTEVEEETPSEEVTTTPTETEEENPTEEVTTTPTEAEEEMPTEEVTATPTEVEEEAPTEEVTATPTETEEESPITEDPPKGRIFHVGESNPENKENYYKDFEAALKAAQTGDTIVLLSDVNLPRTPYTQYSDGRVVESLAFNGVTIDGQGHKLDIPVRPLSLLGDTVFKNLNLSLQPVVGVGEAFASLGSGGALESQQYIYLNGNKLTLDQVDTKIEGQNDRTRPVIVMGAEKGKADAGHAELVVLNADKTNGQTQLKAIVAGSLDSAKESASHIDLGAGTVVLDDVAFADKQPMNGKVTLVNRSNQVRKISGQGTENEVILENVHYSFPEPSFNGVQNLTLKGNSGASLSNLSVADKLTLSAQSNLAVGSFNGGSLSVGNIKSDNATLKLGDHADFKLEGNIQGTLNVKTTQPKDSLEKGANSNAQTGQRADGYVISDQAVEDEVIEQETKVGVNFEFAEDNVFALSDSDTTVLRGTVSDFRDGDRLEIQIWGERYPADVGSDGQFSIAVPTNVLLQDTFDGTDVGQLEIFVWRGDNNVFDGDFNALEYRVISAENAGTTDNELQALAQNSEQNAPLVDEQTEEEMPQTLRIELEEITSDDYLNVSEARAATTTIRGQVSGEGAAEGQKVSLNIGGETREATLDQHLAFSEQVDTTLLVKNTDYQVRASFGEASTTRKYNVAAQATNQIQITDIGEHNPASETVRISGTLRLDGVAAKYHNDLFIDTVQVSLNGKTYTAGLGKAKSSQVRGTFGPESVKDKAFSFDIPVEELRAAQGQTMTFSLPKEYAVIYNDKMGTYNSDPRSIETQYARIDDQSKYSLNPNAWLQGGSGKTIVASEPSAKTYVNGTVDGNAQQGDEVVVQIGTQRYVGEVGGDKRFSVEVDKSALQQAGIDSLSATLSGKDYAQNTIEVSDVSRFQATVDRTSGEFVAKFNTSHHAEEDVPYFIKGIRYGNFYNTEGHLGRQPIGLDSYSLKYHFVNEGSGAIPFTQDEMAMIRDVLKEISSHTRLSFMEKAAIELEDKPDILIHQISSYDGRSRGSAGAGVYFDYRGFSASKASYELAMHELLHSLGTRDIKDEDFGNENSTLTSVMSYNLRMAKATAPMRMQDLMYLHYRYGVNPEQHKGNDVYTFKAMTHYSLENSSYIWDGAGIDTFDASMEDKKVVVDLTPGSWIYRGAQTEKFWADETKYFYNNPKAFFGNSFYEYEGTIIPNVMDYNEDQAFIGYGTQIERLIGSRFDDELKGNVADNDIFGGDGNDQIWGDDGNDYIDGGKGADVMYGGNGNDIFVVDDEADEVHEALDQGTDTVLSYISYKLGENLENLELLGNAQNAEGNALANRIVGNSSANTLTGGAGADTFVFNSPLNGNVDTITDFKVGEDRIELAKAVFTQLTETNIMEYIHYDKASGELRYDPDGSGKQDPIVFAKLSDNLEIGAAQFVLG